jgi:hypothetical protein
MDADSVFQNDVEVRLKNAWTFEADATSSQLWLGSVVGAETGQLSCTSE